MQREKYALTAAVAGSYVCFILFSTSASRRSTLWTDFCHCWYCEVINVYLRFFCSHANFAICHLTCRWSSNSTSASISNGFRDICIQLYLGHDLGLLWSRDVIRNVTIWYPRSGAISYRCSIITQSVSSAIFKIMGAINIGVTTLTFQGHVTIWFAIFHFLLVIHWNWASDANYFETFGLNTC